MGTLGNQPPRNGFHYSLTNFIQDVQRASEETGVSFKEALKAAEIIEMQRRNEIYRQNGDYLDGQLAGFADLIDRWLSPLDEVPF